MIELNPEHKKPLYQQLYEQLKQKIVFGEYKEGTRLTSTRTLAKDLCIGRNTVEHAYDQLCVEGYIESQQGSGYVIQDIQEDLLNFPCDITSTGKVAIPKPFRATDKPLTNQTYKYRYRFNYGEIDPRCFPHAQWKRLTAEVQSSIPKDDLYRYGDNLGEYALREEITKYLYRARGVRCHPDQIVVGSGFQDLVGMICILLSDENKVLAIEEPGYDFARIIFKNHGYDIAPVVVGNTGIDIESLEKSKGKVVYVTPSHQLPLGVVMPIQHRVRLLQWAQKANGIIIEDDYDSEFRYKARPIPALQSIDCSERVIYLGTFSKAFSPGLRMGYMVLPQWLLQRFDTIYGRYKSTVPRLQQHILTKFMAEGRWDRHLRKICALNRKKYELLLQTLSNEMAGKVIVHKQSAGLHILLEFVNGENQDVMVKRAAENGILVPSTRQYWSQTEDAQDNLVLLGFGGVSEQEIEAGIKLLNKVWFS